MGGTACAPHCVRCSVARWGSEDLTQRRKDVTRFASAPRIALRLSAFACEFHVFHPEARIKGTRWVALPALQRFPLGLGKPHAEAQSRKDATRFAIAPRIALRLSAFA